MPPYFKSNEVILSIYVVKIISSGRAKAHFTQSANTKVVSKGNEWTQECRNELWSYNNNNNDNDKDDNYNNNNNNYNDINDNYIS